MSAGWTWMRRRGPGSGRWRGWFGGLESHGHRGGPWGWRGRFFESGEVRLALLSLLAERPMHGYELMKEMEARSGGMYRASAGTVYPNLQQLEDEGLVRMETSEDGKRVYSITDAGRKALKDEAPGVERIWSRASAWDDWSDAWSAGGLEVMGPLMRLARAAFTAAARGDVAQVERVRDLLRKTGEQLEKMTAKDSGKAKTDDVVD
jgi:DNA-binding PadR family transcriptional regulator